MATLSKDGTGSWRARGVAVRDARHVHNGPDIPGAMPARKDKRAWCRGRVGVEHKLAVNVTTGKSWWGPVLLRHCTACGKEFGQHIHHDETLMYKGRDLHAPPDWATPAQVAELVAATRAYRRPKCG